MRCVMGKSDIKRMIELGEWLEEYLKADIQEWEIVDLFQKGASILGVKEKISQECELVYFLKYGKLTEKAENDFLNSPERYIEKLERHRNSILVDKRGTLIELLKKFRKDKLPWQKKLIELEKTKLCVRIAGLRSSYSGLMTAIKKIDDQYFKVKTFESVKGPDIEIIDHDDGTRTFDTIPRDDDDVFPLRFNHGVIISRVFFDFLFLGGQDYYGFCEWCGNFFVSKRKLKKIYCSDNCRASHRNQINREKAATKN